MSPATPTTAAVLNVFIVGGTGLIGTALRQMMTPPRVTSSGTQIVLVGYCNSRFGVTCSTGQTTTWNETTKFNDDFVQSCCGSNGNNNICIADCTASEDVSNHYVTWLQKGWHIATPNKKCNSGPLERYQACLEASHSGKSKWYTEATIGAGLPIVSTLRTLVATGDEILSVQGIFSGTMSFLFNTWNATTTPFSTIVKQAQEAGYTEPDPREDLNGMDVARKVVIAAREAGWTSLELSDVTVESLVPTALENCSLDDFWKEFPQYDAALAERAANAAQEGKVLRFVGAVHVTTKSATVQLQALPSTHAFAGLTGADNIVQVETKRYGPAGGSTPLVIRGPGAGADVTAAGVLGDLVALANAK